MSALAEFHFLRPDWLLGLLPVAFAAALLLRRSVDAGRWRRAVDPELATWLVESDPGRAARFGSAALLLAWTAALLALAGPTWERRPQPVARTDDALIVLLDLSLSMYAQDVTPSRLVRARLKIADVLERRRDGQTGLVVYAGDAHVVVPLTDDVRTIQNLLPSLEPGVMPVLGSRVEDALELASELLSEAEARTGRILLISDEIPDQAAAIAATGAWPVDVLGIGSEAGAPIPLSGIGRNGTLEASGRTVIARFDGGPLRALATASGGRFARFSADDADLALLLDGRSQGLENGEEDEREREFDLWIDMGPWLLLLVLPVVLLCFRRGVVAALVCLILVPGQDAHADGLGDFLQRPDQRAYRALREGRVEDAVQTFEDPRWQAAALYRAEEYEAAAAAFDAADVEDLYNRGTAFARAMKLPEAHAALTGVLQRAPDHEDARHNLEIVEKLLDAERQDSDNEQGSQQDDPQSDNDSQSEASRRDDASDGESGEREQDAEAGEGAEDDPQADDAEGARPEEGENEGEPAENDELLAQRSREQEQALEQWLRRVPDEPGALLRRKFKYETDRRYRQGLRRAPEDTQPW